MSVRTRQPSRERRRRHVLFLVLVLLVSSAVQAVAAPAMAADDFDAVRHRWLQLLTDSDTNHADDPRYTGRLPKVGEVQGFVDRIDPDALSPDNAAYGQLWPTEFVYTTTAGVSGSFTRLVQMATAYVTPGTTLAGDAPLADATVAGLNALVHTLPRSQADLPLPHPSGDWYEWEIEIPKKITNVAVMMWGHRNLAVNDYLSAIKVLTPTCTRSGRSTNVSDYVDPSRGANRVWKCTTEVMMGVLARDAGAITTARGDALEAMATVRVGEGVYADGSFIQHGRHPYSGGYGTSMAQTYAELIYALHGSPWAIDGAASTAFAGWLRDGLRPLVYRGAGTPGVQGREIARAGTPKRNDPAETSIKNHQSGQGLTRAALILAEAMPSADALQLRSMAKGLISADTFAPYPDGYFLSLFTVARAYAVIDDAAIQPATDLTATKVYAGMDQVTHQRPGYMFGVSMFSNRILDYETLGENLRGWFTRYGMTQLVLPDDLGQYDDAYWPTVDATRLPGTTVSTAAGSTTPSSGVPSTASWVGGAALDGRYAAVGMELRDPFSDLSGKKAWFLYDDEIVALGAGITGIGPIVTTVDQRRVSGSEALTINGTPRCATNGSSEVVEGAKSAHLSGQNIGYYFPGGVTLRCKREVRTGAWSEIKPGESTKPHQRAYVSLWIDHGSNPSNASYSYVLLPGATAQQAADYAASPQVSVLRNETTIQAVQQNALDVIGVNFWQPRVTQRLDAWGEASFLTVDDAAAVVLQRTATAIKVAAADPTQQRTGALHMKLNTPSNGLVSGSAKVRLVQTVPAILSITSFQTAGATETAVLATDPQVLRPTHDAMVWKDHGDTNYGTTGLVVKNTGDGWTRRSYLKFDLAGVNPADIASATLRVHGNNTTCTECTTDLAVQSAPDENATGGAWSEDTLTWNNAPQPEGGPIGNLAVGTTASYASGDVTTYVRVQAAGDGVATFVLTEPAQTGEFVLLNSDEAATGQPQLVLTTRGPQVDNWQQPNAEATPIGDAYVDSDKLDAVGGQSTVNAVKYTPSQQRITYLTFDIAQYGAIEYAKLEFHAKVTEAGALADKVVVSEVGDAWNEGLVKWNSKPDVGAALKTLDVSATGGVVGLDVTDYLRRNAADGRASFAISGDPAGSRKYIAITSRESAANPPRLVLRAEYADRPALADTYVDAMDPAATHGPDKALVVDAGNRTALLRYSLDGVADLNRVAVNLYVPQCAVKPVTLTVYGSADGGWTEGGTSWATRPSSTLAPLREFTCGGKDPHVSIDVTGYAISQWLGDQTLSLQVKADDEITVSSKEESANPPTLTIKTS
ncbi:DNRLRE domain-containing protein [Micromonospora yasonensis]|uniref:CBM96 family carbohydrate-binding protein n=1 Tax=Micromonospora yasonensis TaxID=1128667 RepID=UPI0022324A5B|nr:polysaccharide lyase family 8 super-sandwich domain-containing protein [Micromonospora yasonensis]MCW3841951.1 DNRLRE domain-containing protein [Micromonospora yasonensis]